MGRRKGRINSNYVNNNVADGLGKAAPSHGIHSQIVNATNFSGFSQYNTVWRLFLLPNYGHILFFRRFSVQGNESFSKFNAQQMMRREWHHLTFVWGFTWVWGSWGESTERVWRRVNFPSCWLEWVFNKANSKIDRSGVLEESALFVQFSSKKK